MMGIGNTLLIVRKRFFHGWAIVATTLLVGFAGVVAFNPVLAVIMKPMASEMGWSRAAISGAMSVGSLASGGLSLLVGLVVDRRGARSVVALGVAVMGMSLIGVSQVAALWQFYLLFGLSRAISTGVLELSMSVAVANWFVRRRARAMGIAATGPRIGLAILPPLALFLISLVGWRGAWVGLGVTAWAIAILPTLLFVGRRPEDFGLKPDGVPSSRDNLSPLPPTQQAPERIWMAREALVNMSFWMLAAAQAAGMMVSGGINLHQLPHMTDQGIPIAIAVGAISSYAIWAMIGVLAWSFLAEKIGVRLSLGADLALAAAGVFILANVDSIPMAYFYSAFYGLAFGGQMALFPLAWADYFGRASLGTIRGLSRAPTMVFNAAGPLFAGWIYDRTSSYQMAFAVFIVLYLIGAVLIFVSRPPRPAVSRGETGSA
jgi:MFS family permease